VRRAAPSQRIGRRAESAVADFLFASGFTILWRNVRLGALELDVVARKGQLVVVVEVRTRGERSYQRAFESIDAAKRRRVSRAVELLWSRRLSRLQGVERVRIDVAAVTEAGATTRVEYVEGAIGPL
jgi:putative endonuclease